MKYKLGYYLHYLEEDLEDLFSKMIDRYLDHPIIFQLFWGAVGVVLWTIAIVNILSLFIK